jgi:cytosine/adenosine deaminase-related metal-dependent hydrolase
MRGAERAIIIEIVPHAGEPEAPLDSVFDASRHGVLTGLINSHHHFCQTLTRAFPPVPDQELFFPAQGPLSHLGRFDTRRYSRFDPMSGV